MHDWAKSRAWKQALLAKGAVVAAQLAGLLAGKEVDLAAGLPPKLHPDDDPELRLRRFLDLIDRGIKRGAPGTCIVCGVDLPAAALDAAPWTERCAAHG